MPPSQVLIVGAGPTGLVLALCLTKLGVPVRIIDTTEGPGTTSRALVLHARTLELYRQLGIAEAVVAQGLKLTAQNLWAAGRHVGRVPFGNIGLGLSPYPFMLIYPQDRHERLLIDALQRLGVQVERQTELIALDLSDDSVGAMIRRPDGSMEACEPAYVAGCDGAHSTVRQQAGIDFPGGTYSGLFYVADITASGPPVNGEVNVALDSSDIVAIFPLKEPGSVRLVGNTGTCSDEEEGLIWEDVGKHAVDLTNMAVEGVNWFSTYRVHHRVAASFRRGPVFLLGDAAHIHSPVGAQGMNTGIGDAVNLAWKLAAVIQKRINPAALDTYEPERIAFARRLVNTTDAAFRFISSPGPLAAQVRLRLVPFLFPRILTLSRVRRYVFRALSQIAIRYPDSPLSVGSTGGVTGGDRLPWVHLDMGEAGDNFEPLKSLDWQVHCYGGPAATVRDLCRDRGLALRHFAWRPPMAGMGLMKDALYLVRPDGYVGLADREGDVRRLAGYLDSFAIEPLGTGR